MSSNETDDEYDEIGDESEFSILTKSSERTQKKPKETMRRSKSNIKSKSSYDEVPKSRNVTELLELIDTLDDSSDESTVKFEKIDKKEESPVIVELGQEDKKEEPESPEIPIRISGNWRRNSTRRKSGSTRRDFLHRSQLRDLLLDDNLVESFLECLPPEQKPLLELSYAITRYIRLCESADSIVAKTLADNISQRFKDIDTIPSKIRKKISFKQQDFIDRTEVLRTVHLDLFEEMLKYKFPQVAATAGIASTSRRVLARSCMPDPFEDPNETLVEFKDGHLIAATPEKIIQYLTAEKGDLERTNFYLLTYSYYCRTPLDFIKLIRTRFEMVANRKDIDKDSTKITLLRVVNIAKLWIDIHKDSIRNNVKVYRKLKSFAKNNVEIYMPAVGKNLQNYLKTKTRQDNEEDDKEIQFSVEPPKLRKVSSTFEKLSLENMDTLEFARQMALVDHSLYRKITPNELLHLNWTKDLKDELAPNVLSMITQFNRVGEWVITKIETCRKRSLKKAFLTKLIDIAYESYKIANFNGAMALLSGLRHSKVARQKETWDSLSSSSWDKWEELIDILKIEDNFASLRQIMKETPPPLIPYLGVYLSGLTFKETEPTYTKNGLVNLPKLAYIGRVITEVHYGQTTPFCLHPHAALQKYIKKLPFLEKPILRESGQLSDSRRMRKQLTRSGSMPAFNQNNIKSLRATDPNTSRVAQTPPPNHAMSARLRASRSGSVSQEETYSLKKSRSTSATHKVVQTHKRSNSSSKRKMSFLAQFKKTGN